MMDLEIIILDKASQRKTNITPYLVLIYVKSKKIQINFFTKWKQSHRYGKQISGYQKGNGVGDTL